MTAYPSWDDVTPELREAAKPAREAVRAGKSVLLIGPPGAGKTMVARRLAVGLPILHFEKKYARDWEIIMRMAGLAYTNQARIASRPFRAPHHTVSVGGMLGDGKQFLPGELSLAHGGVLFLDEAPEFSRQVLDLVGQTQRDKVVRFPVKPGTFALPCAPADFILVAAANPCPCGYGYAGPALRKCECSQAQIDRYLARLAPLRIDVEVRL